MDASKSKHAHIQNLSAQGVRFTPLKGKSPFLLDWNKSPLGAEDLLSKHPESNYGCVADENFFFVDVDDLDWFLDSCPGQLPKTLVARTGSGKLHLYFKHTDETRNASWMRPVLNPNFKSAPDEPQKRLEYPDQVVGPGSVHPDTGKKYEVLVDAPIAEPTKEWLGWLKSLGARDSQPAKRGVNPLRKDLDIGNALLEARLKFDKVVRDGKAYYNYHALMGKCLVKGALHGSGNEQNNACCAFVQNLENNEFWHQCFAGGCQVPGKTRIALAALNLSLEDLVVPHWRSLFRSQGELNQQELAFVIDRFVPEEGVTGLGGPSGHTKTWLMLSMAKAIRSAPSKLWGEFIIPKRYEVLYITPEVGDKAVNRRLKQLKIQNDEGFLFRTMSMGKKLELDNANLLKAAASRVVFLDTLVRWLNGRNEQSSQEMDQLFQLITDLLSAGAVAVVFAHHSIKGSKQNPWTMTAEHVFRGSGDIIANLSAGHGVFQLDYRERDKTFVHIECVKPRDFEPWQPFQLQGKPYIDVDGDFKMVSKPGECGWFTEEKKSWEKHEEDEDPRASEIRKDIAAGMTKPDIATKLGITVRTIDRILSKKKKSAEPKDEGLFDKESDF